MITATSRNVPYCRISRLYCSIVIAVKSYTVISFTYRMKYILMVIYRRVITVISIPWELPWTSSVYWLRTEPNILLEGPAQHVPAVTTETVEWSAPAVLRLAWCKTFSHHVDPSEPARFFIVSSFYMLWANSCSEKIWFCEQFFFTVSKFSLLWAICV
jgi:hypothetical protein